MSLLLLCGVASVAAVGARAQSAGLSGSLTIRRGHLQPDLPSSSPGDPCQCPSAPTDRQAHGTNSERNSQRLAAEARPNGARRFRHGDATRTEQHAGTAQAGAHHPDSCSAPAFIRTRVQRVPVSNLSNALLRHDGRAVRGVCKGKKRLRGTRAAKGGEGASGWWSRGRQATKRERRKGWGKEHEAQGAGTARRGKRRGAQQKETGKKTKNRADWGGRPPALFSITSHHKQQINNFNQSYMAS
jgi:hypothetical protein